MRNAGQAGPGLISSKLMLRSKTPAKANEIKAAFGLLMLAAVSSTAFAAEWPLFLGTPERNAVLEKTLAPPLEVEWSYDATEPIDSDGHCR